MSGFSCILKIRTGVGVFGKRVTKSNMSHPRGWSIFTGEIRPRAALLRLFPIRQPASISRAGSNIFLSGETMEDTLHESKSVALKGFFLLFFLALVGGGVLLAFQTWKTVGNIEALGESVQTHLSQAAVKFVPENFTSAKRELEGAKHDMDEIVRLLGGVSYLRYVPFWSSRYESLYSFSRIVQQFIDTGVQLSSLVE